MIQIKNLHRRYLTEQVETIALNDVSLTVDKGEFIAVTGPSGCGKSTLMNILGMIDQPTSGSYRFGGEEMAGRSERELVTVRRRRLGFVFQSFNLIEDLSVADNVAMPLRFANLSHAQRKNRVREALELVGLTDRARHKPGQLSGGQQQRVAVARAVIADPALILADEPTGNLDSKNGEDVMELLELLNKQGATIVMVTHSAPHAQRADRVIEMLDGRIVTPFTPSMANQQPIEEAQHVV